MTNLQPDTLFTLLGASFTVDEVADDKVRFHRSDDTLEVWEMSQKWLQKQQSKGVLKLVEK